jgi:hypothetical protein
VIHTDHQALQELLAKKDKKSRLIRWVLLLQEYDLEIVDRRGKDNHVFDHLSHMEGIVYDPVPINESIPGECLAVVNSNDPWFVDYANFLVRSFLPNEMSLHQRRKFFNDLKHYFWDESYLYRNGVYGMIRRCVPEDEMFPILRACHVSPYGGHHAGFRTNAKILQSDFYWPTLFKDANELVKNCDACQRMSNIGRRHEMAMNYNIILETFDVWGMDIWDEFLLQTDTLIF